jgi:uncharacterized membrane protein HdeD (DUF308 family)
MNEVTFYKNNWWMYMVGGLATLLLGIVAVVNPAQTFLTIAFFLGLYLVVAGIIDIIMSLSAARTKQFWIFGLILGAIQALIGIYILQRPGMAFNTFILFVALGLLVRGVVHAVESFDSKYDAVFRVWHVIAAVVSVLASVVIWRYPVQGTLAFDWVIGVFAIINGPLMIAFSLEAKKGFKA